MAAIKKVKLRGLKIAASRYKNQRDVAREESVTLKNQIDSLNSKGFFTKISDAFRGI